MICDFLHAPTHTPEKDVFSGNIQESGKKGKVSDFIKKKQQ